MVVAVGVLFPFIRGLLGPIFASEAMTANSLFVAKNSIKH
jgi:hypothetical protein